MAWPPGPAYAESLIRPVPSAANFLIARTELGPRKLFNELLARDILIRDVSRYPMLADYFRVSVGSPDENDRLIEALKEVMGQSAVSFSE